MFAFILALIGAGLATVTGSLGAELVDRLGIGVDLHHGGPLAFAVATPMFQHGRTRHDVITSNVARRETERIGM